MRKSALRSTTLRPAGTSALAKSAAAPCGSARNQRSTSLRAAMATGSDSMNFSCSAAVPRSAGMSWATGLPACCREVTAVLEGDAELGIELQESAGDAVGNGAGLAADAATSHVHGHVELVLAVGSDERREGALHEIVVGEID